MLALETLRPLRTQLWSTDAVCEPTVPLAGVRLAAVWNAITDRRRGGSHALPACTRRTIFAAIISIATGLCPPRGTITSA